MTAGVNSGAAMSVTMFALRGKDGCGIGDFGDLTAVIDIASAMGLGRVVVCHASDPAPGRGLPLYPAYIDLGQLPPIANHSKAFSYAAQAAALDKEPEVDYAKAYNIKMHYLREVYLREGNTVLSSEDYHSFWKENGGWLEQYAVFCTLRHKYGTGNNRYWSEPDYTRLLEDSNFIKEYSDDIRFHCFVQFLLYQQLERVRAYAGEHGISLSVHNADRDSSFRYHWSQMSSGSRNEVFANLGFSGYAPDYPEPWIAETYLRYCLDGTPESMVMPMEDWLAVTNLTRSLPPELEVINPPFDQPSAWRYRMGISVEDILSHRSLLECIRSIIADSIK